MEPDSTQNTNLNSLEIHFNSLDFLITSKRERLHIWLNISNTLSFSLILGIGIGLFSVNKDNLQLLIRVILFLASLFPSIFINSLLLYIAAREIDKGQSFLNYEKIKVLNSTDKAKAISKFKEDYLVIWKNINDKLVIKYNLKLKFTEINLVQRKLHLIINLIISIIYCLLFLFFFFNSLDQGYELITYIMIIAFEILLGINFYFAYRSHLKIIKSLFIY